MFKQLIEIQIITFNFFVSFIILLNISCQRVPDFNLIENVEVKKLINEYQTIIPELIQEQNIPGLSIALIDRKGVVWSEGFGYTDIEKTSPITPETIFSIQSISKSLTATAIMFAVQDGILDLDAPIEKYLPEFKINSHFEKHPIKRITLRHLLSHKAGFTHEAPVGNNYTSDTPSFKEHVESIQQTWLRYPVGQRYCYSNLGIDLAAYILQSISNITFKEYLQEKLFTPLGMVNSSADANIIIANQNRAIGHSSGRKEHRIAVPMLGAGGIYSSANELAKFVQFHINKGNVNNKELLDTELFNEMYKIPFPVKGQTEGYALGINMFRKYNSIVYYHGGGGYGFLTDMAWYPKFGIGIVILTNSSDHNLQWNLVNEILDKIIKINIKNETISIRDKDLKFFKLDVKKKDKLVGSYAGKRGMMNIELKDDILGIKECDEFQPFTFYAENEAYIDKQNYYDYYRFILNKEGIPDYIVKLNGGNTWDYNEGPNDKPGPNKMEWDKYTGDYLVYVGGNPMIPAKLLKKNGYLYVVYLGNSYKLIEVQPDVFYTSTGEILELGNKMLFASTFKLVKK